MKKTIKQEYGLTEKRISMGLFDFDVLCVTGKIDGLRDYIVWKLEDSDFSLDSDYDSRGWCIYKKGYVPVIWIPKKPKSARDYATVAHECVHAVFHLFEWANIPITRDTEEVMTHAVGHLVDGILSKK